MNTRTLTQRRDVMQTMLAIAAVAALLLSLAFSLRPGMVAAFTAGDNGHPTGGQSSDLKGADATFAFQTNAAMDCRDTNVTQVSFTIDYDIDGTAPAGAFLVVYLSPNQGAINGNAGADEAGYIADVESNFATVDIAELSGSGSVSGTISVSTAFVADTGGILGVIADEADGDVSNSKTNSLNCGEATGTGTPVPTGTPEQTVAPTGTPEQTVAPTGTPEQTVAPTGTPEQTVAPTGTPEQTVGAATGTPAPTSTPEGGVHAATGTPGASQPDTATSSLVGNGSAPTMLFVLILLLSLGGLAFLNVDSARKRS